MEDRKQKTQGDKIEMSLIKGIIKYIFILLLIGLGAVVLMGAAMMLFGVQIFGYRYINVNERVEYLVSPSSYSRDHYENADKVTTIEVNAGNMNVTIYPHNYNWFAVNSLIQGNGFSKGDGETSTKDMYTTLKPEIVQNEDGTYKLVITSKTADGVVNLTHHRLQIAVPATSEYAIASNLQNLTVTTRAGSINIDKDIKVPTNDAILKMSNFTTLQTTSGDINVRYGSINHIKAKTDSGKMIFSSTVGNIKKTAQIESNTGNIKFEKGVDIEGNCLFKSGISRITLNNISSKFEYEGESAYLEIGKVTGQVYIKSSDAVVNIEEISGSGAWISAGYNPESRDNNEPNKVGNRKFRIGKADVSTLFLETNTGEIYFGELISTETTTETKKSGNLLTESGNITIDKLIGNVSAITKSGNIKINQATYADEPSYADTLKSAYIKVQSEKGNIVLNDIVGELHVKVKEDGNAPITINMLEVNSNSEIIGQKGNMKLNLPVILADGTTKNIYSIAFFTLNADNSKKLSKGSISINLSALSEINDRSKYQYVQDVKQNAETGKLESFGDEPFEGKPVLTIYSAQGDITINSINN